MSDDARLSVYTIFATFFPRMRTKHYLPAFHSRHYFCHLNRIHYHNNTTAWQSSTIFNGAANHGAISTD